MMCAVSAAQGASEGQPHGRIYRISERSLRGDARAATARSLGRRAAPSAAGDADPRLRCVGLNFHLYAGRAQGFRAAAGYRAADRLDPGRPKHLVPADAAEADPVHRHRRSPIRRSIPRSASPAAAARSGGANTGTVFASLKPMNERRSARRQGDRAAARAACRGGRRHAVPAIDRRSRRRRPLGNAAYQYTLKGSTSEELNEWTPKLVAALQSGADARRRQQRPAEQGRCEANVGHRPRRRLPPRHHGQPARQHAV